jgi:hypothetical protein
VVSKPNLDWIPNGPYHSTWSNRAFTEMAATQSFVDCNGLRHADRLCGLVGVVE